MFEENQISTIPHQSEIKVYTMEGETYIEQENPDGSDSDVVQVALGNLDLLIAALQKAKATLNEQG